MDGKASHFDSYSPGRDNNFVFLFAFLKCRIVAKLFIFESNFEFKQLQRVIFWIQSLNRSDSASRLLERATLWTHFFLIKSGLEKFYGVKNHVLILFWLQKRQAQLFVRILKMNDSDSNFPKKLRITVFENFTFQRIRLGNEIFFNFSDFELKLSQRLGFCIKLIQWVGLSGFFSKRNKFWITITFCFILPWKHWL